jgi:dTDP-glucose 4,6-dehydratase
MSNSHIFLTGGTGFFGKALLRHWANLDQKAEEVPRVTLLSRDPNRFATEYPEFVAFEWLHLVQGDVCNPDSLPRHEVFTHVLHAATDSTNGPRLLPLQRFDQIVTGTRNVLDLAVMTGASRFLLTSSGGVYGAQPTDIEKISEDYQGAPDPMNPNNAYSMAKRCAEHLCVLYQDQYGLDTVIARCFAFVGQDLPLNVHFAIGNFIRDALTCREIMVKGDGSPTRSFMDQRDLARWLFIMLLKGKPGNAYNVGSDFAINITDLACKVRDLIAPEKSIYVSGISAQNNFRDRYIPSIAKARKELDLQLTYTLDESILDVAKVSISAS